MSPVLSAPSLARQFAIRCSSDWCSALTADELMTLQSIVRTALIDTAACILAGRNETVTQLVSHCKLEGSSANVKSASVFFGDAKIRPATAALLNGVSGHALDFDDVGLAGHPSVVIVPALLADCESRGISGEPVVQAYAKGYAIWAELDRRMRTSLHEHGWHPTSVFGVVAAAGALAALRGLNESAFVNVIGIAASFAGGVVSNFGSMTKPLHAGRAAESAIVAADLGEAGVTASEDSLDGKAGLLLALCGSEQADVKSIIPAFFERAALDRRPGVKQYPVCYAAHRGIDAMLDLRAKFGVKPEDVATLTVTISETNAAVLRHHQPRNVGEARFSMEFALASALVYGRLGIREVSQSALEDPRVRSVMRLVRTQTVRTSCPFEPTFAYADELQLELQDGTVAESGPVRFARGHRELPLGEDQIRQKLLGCVNSDEQQFAEHVEKRMTDLLLTR